MKPVLPLLPLYLFNCTETALKIFLRQMMGGLRCISITERIPNKYLYLAICKIQSWEPGVNYMQLAIENRGNIPS